ncbi:MAG: terminase family protein [Ignavibacteria bacterium]
MIKIIVIILFMNLVPNSKPQEEFLASSEYEVLYGGAAGGGKTRAIVMDPLRYIDYQDYTAIIFRRTYPELDGSVLPEALSIYKNLFNARYNDSKHIFTFPSGAWIRLAYMKKASDWMNYQGHEYAGQYYDELTHFTEDQYLKLGAWNRSKVDGIEPYRRSTSNPGGPGHLWVKKRFPDKSLPIKDGPLRYSLLANMMWQPMKAGQTYWDINEFGHKLSRRFIPARVFDNKDLLRRNPNYLAQLLQLPKRMQKALIEGDWNAFEGQFFDFDYYRQVITKPFLIPREWRLVGSLDPGYSAPCSFSLGAMDFMENYYRISTYYQKGLSPTKHAINIKTFIKNLPWTEGRMPELIVADPYAWAKRDRHAVLESKKTFADVCMEEGLVLSKANNDRTIGWWAMKDMMTMIDEDTGDYKYFVFDKLNVPFLEQIVSTSSDENDPEDIEGKGLNKNIEDHCIDEERYRCMAIYKPTAQPEDLPGSSGRSARRNKKKNERPKGSFTL